MTCNKRSGRRSGKAVRDPSAYARISVPSKISQDVAENIVDPVEVHDKDDLNVDSVSVETPGAGSGDRDSTTPEEIHKWMCLDQAKQQAAARLKLEYSIRKQMHDRPVVKLTAQSENTVVERMRSGELSMPLPALADDGEVVGVREWTRGANFVYETLVQYGFGKDDVERSMLATGGGGDVVDAIMWLCVNVPTERMPVDMRDKHEFRSDALVASSKAQDGEKSNGGATEGEEDSSGSAADDEDGEDDSIGCATDDQDSEHSADEEWEPVYPRIDQAPGPVSEATSEQAGISPLAELGLGSLSDYDSDENPSEAHAVRVLQLRGCEEWQDFLRQGNQRNDSQRHGAHLQALRQRIGETQRALRELEDDLLFSSTASLEACERMWPTYYDALLDDIRRFRGSDNEAAAMVATYEVVRKEEIACERSGDGSDSDGGSSIGSLGLGALDADWEDSGRPADGPAVPALDVSAPAGWTGAQVRDVASEAVRRRDRRAVVRYRTWRAGPGGSAGFAGVLTVEWTQAGRAQRLLQRAQPEAVEASGLTHTWTGRANGTTARDAGDLAALTFLYATARLESGAQRLAPALADLWREWDAERERDAQAGAEAERAARATFLQRLRERYEAGRPAGEAERETGSAGEDEGGKGPSEADARRVAADMALRARMWGRRTMDERRQRGAARVLGGPAQADLPARQHRRAIDAALRARHSAVAVIRGETGSGKSTQIPQFVLEHVLGAPGYAGGRVICTQPRRLAAAAVGARVSREVGDAGVGARDALVGVQMRFDARAHAANALVFCTVGVLLRMLDGDPDLRGVACVICDEVQERTLELDYLLLVLRRLVRRRPLRLVLMSATVDASALARYFGACPVVDIPGRTFPVACLHLAQVAQLAAFDQPIRADGVDVALVVHVLRGLCLAGDSGRSGGSGDPSDPGDSNNSSDPWTAYCRAQVPRGAVLVFLPGMGDIRRVRDALLRDARVAAAAWVVPLHSALANEAAAGGGGATHADAAFGAAPAGRRKVVLATNVAETGVTIPDVTVVVDTGLARQPQWDARRRLTVLATRRVSLASARQRRGRAGRVQPGVALCLYAAQDEAAMLEFEPPEMLRLPLTRLCLQAKAHGFGDLIRLMQAALDPPPQAAVAHAVRDLQRAGALDAAEALTPLGRLLARLPVDLPVGKLLIAGALLRCLDPVLTIAASLSITGSVIPQRALADPPRHLSDFAPLLSAYAQWRAHLSASPPPTPPQRRAFCAAMAFSRDALDALEDCREQYLRILRESGLVAHANTPLRISGLVAVPAAADANAASTRVLHAALASALDEHVIMPRDAGYVVGHVAVRKRVEGVGRAIQIVDHERVATQPVTLDPRSAVLSPAEGVPFVAVRLSAAEGRSASAACAHELVRASLMHLVLFARDLDYWPKAQRITVNRWIEAICRARSAVVLMALRWRYQDILTCCVSGKPLPRHLAQWLDAIVLVLRAEDI